MNQIREYLGDAVYAVYPTLGNMLQLTTGNHDPKLADNVIYLEPDVVVRLVEFLDRIKEGK